MTDSKPVSCFGTILFIFIAIVGLIAVYDSLFGPSDQVVAERRASEKATKQASVVAEKKIKPTIKAEKVDLLKLYYEFEDNEVAASVKYENKPIKMSGFIRNFEKNLSTVVRIQAKEYDASEYDVPEVYAHISEKSIPAVANYRKGQRISVLCQGASKDAFVRGTECEIIK